MSSLASSSSTHAFAPTARGCAATAETWLPPRHLMAWRDWRQSSSSASSSLDSSPDTPSENMAPRPRPRPCMSAREPLRDGAPPPRPPTLPRPCPAGAVAGRLAATGSSSASLGSIVGSEARTSLKIWSIRLFSDSSVKILYELGTTNISIPTSSAAALSLAHRLSSCTQRSLHSVSLMPSSSAANKKTKTCRRTASAKVTSSAWSAVGMGGAPGERGGANFGSAVRR
eukprot:scaffold1756_cov117-Isochrysis_galbana.AAC.19